MKKVYLDEIITNLQQLRDETEGDAVSAGKVMGTVFQTVKLHAVSFEEKTELAAAAASMDGLRLDEALDLAEMKQDAKGK